MLGAFEAAARRIPSQQQRSFTCTALRHASITHFTPTSSPVLDGLLNEIRTKIILPFYLPESQRKRLFAPKWRTRLEKDPVIIEIDGEVLKFGYHSPGHVPSARKSLLQAVAQFDTAEDFANLKPLIAGLHYARRRIEPPVWAKVLRLAGIKGRIYNIIDCARSVRDTGYRLDTSEKVNEILHFVQMKARDADWDEAETRQALRWAAMVFEMVHDKAHQPKLYGKETPVPGERPLYLDPMVVAAPLHLAAVLAVQHPAADKSILDKVRKLARAVVAFWPEGQKLKEVYPAELYKDYNKMGYLSIPSKFVALATPLLHGLETAIKVVDPELAGQLQARRDLLAAEIKEARDTLVEEIEWERETGVSTWRRGEDVYKSFYAP